MRQSSGMAAGDGELAVEEVSFYSVYGGGATVDGDDSDSRFIEVALAPRSVEMYFEPIFGVLKELGATETVAARSRTVGARAVARIDSYVCRVPPLMICDLLAEVPAIDQIGRASCRVRVCQYV